MLALGHLLDDERVFKMAKSLSREYSIGVAAMDMPRGSPETEGNDISFYAIGGKYKRLFYAFVLIRRLHPDIIHCHDIESLPVGLIVKLISRKRKLIFDVHEFYERTKYNWNSIGGIFANIVISLLIPILGRLIDGFVFVDLAQSKFYTRFNKPRTVIYNFPSLRSLKNDSHTRGIEGSLLIYEGGVSEDRGIFEYLAIINGIKSEMPDSKLTVLGWFDRAETRIKVENYIRDNELTNNVEINERLPHKDVLWHIEASRIGLCFISDSCYNPPLSGLPTKVFDYMSCGVPVLCSKNLVKLSNLIKDNGCGLSVEYDDNDGAIAAIRQILNNYDKFSENCLKAIQIYNWENEERKLLPFYETVLTINKFQKA